MNYSDLSPPQGTHLPGPQDGLRAFIPPGCPLLTLLVVGGVALVIRAAFFAELLHKLPFYGSTYPGFDQHLYDQWAQAIAAGDWLSTSQRLFYGSPLYPYLLACAYCIAGTSNVLAGIVMNGIFGVCAAVLAAALGGKLFGRWGALAAGLLMALNGSQVSWEAVLVVDSLLPAFCLGALLLIVTYLERGCVWGEGHPTLKPLPLWVWLFPGLLLGLATLGLGIAALAAAGLCILIGAVSLRRPVWRAAAAAGLMALAICLVVAVPILRNGLMYGRWTATLNGPVTFYIGNAPGATGVFGEPPGFAETRERLEKSTHPASAWLQQLRADLKAHPGALRAALLRKTCLLFNSWDAPDNSNYYFARHYTLSLRYLTFGPLFLYVVGFLGIALTFRRWRALLPLYVFGALFGLGLVLVFMSGRYKLPFLALLTVFGGGAAAILVEHLRACRFRLPLASVLFAGLLTAAFWPRGPVGLGGEWTVFRPPEYLNNAAVLMKEGREAEALALLEDGHALFPRKPEFIERLAYLYLKTGRPQDAAAVTERAVARGVVSRRILERRVLAYEALSQWDKAHAAATDLRARYPESELGKEPVMTPQ